MAKPSHLKEVIPLLLALLIIILLLICWKYWNNNDVEGYESNPIDKIDGVVYINLENREDRKKLIKEEMDKMGIPEDKIHKVSGVFIPKNGHKGNVQSFILALQLAKMNNWETVLLLEDDAKLIVSEEEFKSKLNEMFNYLNNKEWDVIMLGQAYGKKVDTDNINIKKISSATTKTAIIIKSHYYNKLLNNFNSSNDLMLSHKKSEDKYEKYASDQRWRDLQETGNWYSFTDDIVKQGNIWSSTMKYSY